MNEVRKLYNDDGCVLKEASSNDYESWSSARTLGPMERRKEYRNLCYNFEYERGTNIPHCAKKGVCDEDCEYMRNFKEQDMKQTLEEAAKSMAYDKMPDWGGLPMVAKKYFIKGAEWQSKQSPWISVKERLPEQNKLVLCRMVSNGAIVSGYIVVSPGRSPYVATDGGFEFEDWNDYECDMWMLIPSFDEILEANKDVLERIKEKGD